MGREIEKEERRSNEKRWKQRGEGGKMELFTVKRRRRGEVWEEKIQGK